MFLSHGEEIMLGVILVRNRATDDAFARTIEAARSTGLANLTVIADAAVPGMRTITGAFSSEMIASEMTANGAARTIIVDARLAPSNSQFQAVVGAISRGRGCPVNYIPIRRNGRQIEISSLRAANLVEFLSSSPEWPVMIVGVERNLIESIREMTASSSTELLASLMAACSVNDMVVSAAGSAIDLGASFDENSSLALSGNGLSAVIQNMLKLCAIEEMFPAHPWEHHEAESGAAAYHALAALFLRCGDLENSTACLNLSDNLEDSPRSLALRAFIDEQKGDTLRAVANMVASLQGYETRKGNDGSHYLTFAPSDGDNVSRDLQSGLAALNKSDNAEAYHHFSRAVMEFDPLFKSARLAR
jgi:hypothetical protein